MNFDFYYPTGSGENMRPGITPRPSDLNQFMLLAKSSGVFRAINEYRAGNKNAKKALPAICYMGKCEGKRSAAGAQPTGFVMIDVDHVENALKNGHDILEKVNSYNRGENKCELLIVHITPSGKGLRVVFVERQEWGKSVAEQQAHFAQTFGLPPIDEACKDLSRLSFLPKADDILYLNDEMWQGEYVSQFILPSLHFAVEEENETEVQADFSQEELKRFSEMNFRGHDIIEILEAYLRHAGPPSPGERHSYYNTLIKYFRCIANNDMRYLLWLLPSFGHSVAERWSQIKSICRVNTLSTIPSGFYAFLAKFGYIIPKEKDIPCDDAPSPVTTEDWAACAPPVLRELLSIAPPNFQYPALCALLPILGTLTTFAQAVYPWDDRKHTTSFFSVVVAPPSAGKGFVDKYMDLLFSVIKVRDMLEAKRESIYIMEVKNKKDGDIPPAVPTSQRIMPAKNSEAELLTKQWQNNGAHMFTFAAEMDSWAKGVRAAGGNKDDMIRVAWDNGEYGQSFRSSDTFKGSVKLYWNVLVTGTLQQTLSYFKNVENGLVSRVSFSTIEGTDFAAPSIWGKLTEQQKKLINAFALRCDCLTYQEQLQLGYNEVKAMSDEEVKHSPWRFNVLDKVTYDIDWIMPTIENFNNTQIDIAAANMDYARDMFRRRTCVRGFRLALLCSCLYSSENKVDRQLVCGFVSKFMNADIENSIRYFGEEYNVVTREKKVIPRHNVFSSLPGVFTRKDVESALFRFGVRSSVKQVLYLWKKNKFIIEENENYKKIKNTAI